LACNSTPSIEFIGIDPAKNMRGRAIERTKQNRNIKILDGSFQKVPLEARSIDYMYSIFAFHWTTDLEASVKEISRVLKPAAEMDLFFIGRNNGREFIQRTSPIFLKYMGPRPFPGVDSHAEAAEEGRSLSTFCCDFAPRTAFDRRIVRNLL
jgi:ubiquinone/menaquinone biosynthesis C-methylase UbiE